MKVSVIGMGAVGTEIVGFLVNMSEVTEIVAVDKVREKAEAELWDFSHTTPFTYAKNPTLVAGGFEETAGSDIVVITAGAQLQKGQTRDDLVRINSGILQGLIASVERHSPQGIVINVTNPVDVMTQVMLRASNYPRERLISAGTLIDTALFLRILSDHVKIDPKNLYGYMLGDHGATGFIPWSLCRVCGTEVDTFCRLNGLPPVDREAVRLQTLEAGFRIFERKGNTNHGIAASVFRIIRAIEGNEQSILPLGVLLQGEYGVDDLVMSVPCVVGRGGVERILCHEFAPEENAAFHESERHLRDLLALA
ncbi:MAG: L-lactate dehydrogenase [Candidatus Dactylopiibacterium carminicum]|uniref:L-lactate dehydrogenase n=1 Tax=Candidatus Dactylopiibacterium carminicum TaxID=857335 RepID=A0A272EV51_9RHOO|nr:L-lactate dehydrogenase [Candidatus Dactylopiibacterium carminicum]KAF7599863.1 L-lactate dehydrogenase [Candidatus Dactylopiibacterium carminicum]PAS93974.1 MAG: L-lactate dehydrogenase [Candidatus Dactylopiibacterium carminicum]PAS97290.1 MAG: L-lactate dehydrogenase [Candidatus Dactylopiibacterium carminicum]PAS99864.1 MAG: L-lactate dehydrogenase [Candidatus Dactylopiibacterium carminicum]